MSRRNLEIAAASSLRPTIEADLAGAMYAAEVSVDHRKNFGLYLTPVAVADFIASQIKHAGERIRILDPGAGAGILLCAAVEALLCRPNTPSCIELVAYEVDNALAKVLSEELARPAGLGRRSRRKRRDRSGKGGFRARTRCSSAQHGRVLASHRA